MSVDKMFVSQIFVSLISVGQMSVDKMFVHQISVGQMSVDKMFVHQISDVRTSVGQMSVDKMFVGQMVFDQKTWSHHLASTMGRTLKTFFVINTKLECFDKGKIFSHVK